MYVALADDSGLVRAHNCSSRCQSRSERDSREASKANTAPQLAAASEIVIASPICPGRGRGYGSKFRSSLVPALSMIPAAISMRYQMSGREDFKTLVADVSMGQGSVLNRSTHRSANQSG